MLAIILKIIFSSANPFFLIKLSEMYEQNMTGNFLSATTFSTKHFVLHKDVSASASMSQVGVSRSQWELVGDCGRLGELVGVGGRLRETEGVGGSLWESVGD